MPANETITVEWIATAQQMLATIQKVDAKLERQEKVMQKLTDTSKKGADAAAGSFNKLEHILRKNEAALKDMSVGSGEFDAQKAKVDRLRESYEKMKAAISGKTGAKQEALIPDQKGSLADIESQLKAVEAQLRKTASTSGEFKKLEAAYGNLKKRHDEMTASLKKLGTEAPKVAIHAAGSFNKLEMELREAEAALKELAVGTKEFDAQKAKVDALRGSLKNVKKDLETIEPEVKDITGSFNRLEKEVKDNEDQLKKLQIGTKAFTDQKKKVDELRASFAGAKQSIAGSKSALSSLGGEAISKLAGLASGMAGFKILLEATIAEFERAQQVRMKASTTMQSVEGAIADMALNIGADNVAEARGMIEKNAPELGVTQEGLASMLAAGISGGAKDLDEALKLSSATLKLTAGDAQKAIPIMSGMLTMASTTGNRDFESTLGQLSQFQEAARGEDLAVSISNMATAMAAANTKGERIDALGSERTLEMASVMSQLLQDKDMSITGTTMRQMFSKMDSFIPKTKATLDDGTKSTLTREQVAEFSKLGTMDERVQAMRENPEIAKQFLSTIEENQGKSAVRQIVTGTDKAKELEAAAAEIVTSPQGAKEDFDALVSVIAENTKNLQAANKSKAADQVTDAKTALEGSIIESFNRAVEGMTNASGLDSLTLSDARNALKMRMASGQDAATAATTTLEELKAPETAFGFIPVGGSVSQDDQAKIDAQIAIIRDLAKSVMSVEERRITDNAEVMAKQTDKDQDGKITGQEARDMLLDLNAKGQMTEGMQNAVASADKDRKGFATPDELTKVMASNAGFRDLLVDARIEKNVNAPQQNVEPIIANPQPVDPMRLVSLQNAAAEAHADVTENKTGLTRIAREERAAMANAALLEEQNRLLAEQNQLMAQQNAQQTPQRQQLPPQKQRPQVAPLPAATAP